MSSTDPASGSPVPSDVVRVERHADARAAIVTLNRPEARNALNSAVQAALPAAIAALDADEDVDAIIVTGADPAFCAGVDLKELAAGDKGLVLPKEQRGPFPPHRTPIIGAVNGVAVTGGLELALACDFLVASEHARFADTHARVGVMPGWGMTVLLPQAVGLRRAREMSATGNYIDADTALAWGLVNHVVAHDQLLPTCLQLAADIASNDPDAVRQLLATYDDAAAVSLGDGWALEAERSRAWARERLTPGAVEARRQAVLDRGRAQQG